MKKLMGIAACTAILSFTTSLYAQESVGKDIEKGAKAVGNKTAEVAVKGASKVADKTYKDKVGPAGQTIYIDKYSKYYWVDKKGGKVYVTKAELKNKPVK